jgi:hypothetical protein
MTVEECEGEDAERLELSRLEHLSFDQVCQAFESRVAWKEERQLLELPLLIMCAFLALFLGTLLTVSFLEENNYSTSSDDGDETSDSACHRYQNASAATSGPRIACAC